MDTIKAIECRSSTRAYMPKALSDEQVRALVEAGLRAPTANNRREIRFSVLSADNEILGQIEAEKNRLRNISAPERNFYYDAPTVIMLAAESGLRWSSVDAGIAVENIALAAEAMGLGSVIIGCIYDAMRGDKCEHFHRELKFPDGYLFEVAIAVGYKAAEKPPHTYRAEKQVVYI